METMNKKAITVLSRDGRLTGKTTGGQRQCQMEGCTGSRIGVRWKDGTLTYPCTHGMVFCQNDVMRIV